MRTATASRFILTATIAAALACLPGSAFAQHGGGGHGGGGGGFHGGGGGGAVRGGGFSGGGAARGGFSGGGRSLSEPSAPRGGGAARPSGPSSARRPSGNFSRPGAGNYRPPTGNFSGNAAVRDGQWHAFGGGSASFGRPGVGPGGNFVRGGPGFNGFGGFRGRPGLGFGFAFQNRFGFGGFGFGGFGFGRGFGFGLGWGGWGWGGWGLGWGLGWDPCWGFGWSWNPYCYGFAAWPAYPPYGYLGYDSSGYSDPVADPYPPNANYDQSYSPDSSNNYPRPSDSVTPAPPSLIDPNWDTSANVPNAAAHSDQPVVIYLKDGSSFLPADYWMIDDQFHYTLGGHEYLVPLSRVDLQKTNDVNHQNGATFWLKSAPDANPAPEPAAPPAPASDKSPANDAAAVTL